MKRYKTAYHDAWATNLFVAWLVFWVTFPFWKMRGFRTGPERRSVTDFDTGVRKHFILSRYYTTLPYEVKKQ